MLVDRYVLDISRLIVRSISGRQPTGVDNVVLGYLENLKKEKVLYQSCHILHKQGKYYIVHFKELFALDGKSTNFSEEDIGRRNTIANLLAEWGLVKLVDARKSSENKVPLSQIKVIAYKEKNEWELVTKYNVGKR